MAMSHPRAGALRPKVVRLRLKGGRGEMAAAQAR